MNRLLLLIFFSFTSFAFSAGFNEGVAAYDEENYEEAFHIFSQLAELGHVDAINNLGTLYQTGKGTLTNYVYAANSYKQAASLGHIDAAYNYSNLARLGIGVQKNSAEAYAWAVVAARHGASDMVAYRSALLTRLKPEELKSARIISEEILEELSTHELALGWLLPNDIKLPSRMLTTSFSKSSAGTAHLPQEKFSPNMDAPKRLTNTPTNSHTSTDPLSEPKDLPDNMAKIKPVISYQPIQKTYPTHMSRSGQVVYRSFTERIDYVNGTLLRPRREIPPRSFPIINSLDVSDTLKHSFESLAKTYNVHVNDVIRATQTLNPDAFEEDLPLRLKDPNYRLKIPSYRQIKPN